jgi:ceramide glucosyltransferase
MTPIAWLLLLLSVAAIWFYGYGIYAAIACRRPSHPLDSQFHPPVSILKPLCGLDREAESNLASFVQQDYPEYQIIFAVRDRQDPIIPVVQQIADNFPQVDIKLVVSDRPLGANFKVNNLINAAAVAKHEIFLIADSDIRVERNYLSRVVLPLQDDKVGVVTCLYRSSAQGWVSVLEAIGTATDFQAGVLVSDRLEGIKFALGSTIVIRRAVLQQIGGLEAIADDLADDFQLGHLPARAGYRVALADYIVEHVLPESRLADALQRQIRWARCVRVSRPWGHLGLILTYGTVTSFLLAIATQGAILGWTVLASTWVMRLLMGWIVGVNVLADPVAKKFFWLMPLRDLLSWGIWCYSFLGSTIKWRGQQFKLTKGGKLVPISEVK